MAQVIWTEPALQDLNDIAEYIALDKISAANKFVQKVFSSVDRLEQSPESGRKPPEINNSRYLEIIVNPCRIFYRIEKDKVFMLYVMRSERKLRNYLLDERANESSNSLL
ncbi:MAG: type II toxin-antitoxin system RelE/ParE family toxin [Gammaproteobacteria bacterium]|nr:type II toxin-antitoxin system RelE/ParE family toxin [Gammaproteobacteria bacterium]